MEDEDMVPNTSGEADPVGMGRKSCLFTMCTQNVLARLSAHTNWISCVYLEQYPRLPFCGLIYIYMFHLLFYMNQLINPHRLDLSQNTDKRWISIITHYIPITQDYVNHGMNILLRNSIIFYTGSFHWVQYKWKSLESGEGTAKISMDFNSRIHCCE